MALEASGPGLQHIQVLHGESSKRLATPRNTKNKKHIQSTPSAQPKNLTDQAPSTTERTAWETQHIQLLWLCLEH